MSSHFKHTVSGFTLVELLATIAIIAILFGIGVPSFRTVTTSSRVSSEINGLLVDLQFARSEALKEGQPVTMCVSTDGASCTGGTDWKAGWIAFSDPNADANVDVSETLLKIQKPFTGTDSLTEANSLSSLTFNREGFALNLASGAFLTLHDSSSNKRFTRCLAVTLTGSMETLTHTSSPTKCT